LKDLNLPLTTTTDFASCEGSECPSATEALLQIEGFKYASCNRNEQEKGCK